MKLVITREVEFAELRAMATEHIRQQNRMPFEQAIGMQDPKAPERLANFNREAGTYVLQLINKCEELQLKCLSMQSLGSVSRG